MLRLIYRFLYWYAEHCGGAARSRIINGFYTKYRHPDDVPQAELKAEIDRLGNAVITADEESI